jgi:hypothetical protein
MQTFAIILCGFIIVLLMIIGFMMDEIDKWKRVAFNYKKSYEATKKYIRQTCKSIEHIYGTCGLTHRLKDWRDMDAQRSSKGD